MSLLDLADKAKDAKEPQSQPDGQYKVEIAKVEDGASGPESKQPGEPYTMFYFRIANPKASPAQLLSTCMMHVTENTAEDQAEMRALNLKRLMTAFKLTKADLAPDKYDKLKGKSAWADVREKDDPTYGIQNVIKKWVNAD